MAGLTEIGFQVWRGTALPMAEPHLHADLELNFCLDGTLIYEHGGQRVDIPPRRLGVLWGALPHQLIQVDGRSAIYWATVPLRDLLGMRLPLRITEALLRGEVLLAPADAGQSQFDQLQLEQWIGEWPQRERREQIRYEVAARLRRAVLDWEQAQQTGARARDDQAPLVARVARVVAERYQEAIGISDIARACGVHPKYLAGAFRRAAGMGPHDYLTRMRLAHAQHLLRASDRAVTAIALDSGFASLNAFYTAFRTHLHTTPTAWRGGGWERQA